MSLKCKLFFKNFNEVIIYSSGFKIIKFLIFILLGKYYDIYFSIIFINFIKNFW